MAFTTGLKIGDSLTTTKGVITTTYVQVIKLEFIAKKEDGSRDFQVIQMLFESRAKQEANELPIGVFVGNGNYKKDAVINLAAGVEIGETVIYQSLKTVLKDNSLDWGFTTVTEQTT